MRSIWFGLIVVLCSSMLSFVAPQSGFAEEEGARKALVRQGARLWSPYCGSCHNARPSAERSPAEWDTVMMHMRVRANMLAPDARALLEYLKSR
jgi:mono/diheme cytochrome c family protein